MKGSIEFAPVELSGSIGWLRLSPKQLEALRGLVRITGMTDDAARELAAALERHPDVPGNNYQGLARLVEDKNVLVLASHDAERITSVSIGCFLQAAPCNDLLVHQGFINGFPIQNRVDPIHGYIHRMKPKMGNLLAVLTDPFGVDSALHGRGFGGAHIAAHMLLQAKHGNQELVGFCPSDGCPKNTAVYKQILRGFGFELSGRALFGELDMATYSTYESIFQAKKSGDGEGSDSKCIDDQAPKHFAYALCHAMAPTGKHVFHAMTANLSGLMHDPCPQRSNVSEQPSAASC